MRARPRRHGRRGRFAVKEGVGWPFIMSGHECSGGGGVVHRKCSVRLTIGTSKSEKIPGLSGKYPF